jgi:hypothetical protein
MAPGLLLNLQTHRHRPNDNQGQANLPYWGGRVEVLPRGHCQHHLENEQEQLNDAIILRFLPSKSPWRWVPYSFILPSLFLYYSSTGTPHDARYSPWNSPFPSHSCPRMATTKKMIIGHQLLTFMMTHSYNS